MARFFVGCVLAVSLGVFGTARAQTAPVIPVANPAKVFVTVDAVHAYGAGRIAISGVVQGESAPSTFLAYSSSSDAQWAANCERLALMAMAKPGQYLLELQTSTAYVLASCKLTRVNP